MTVDSSEQQTAARSKDRSINMWIAVAVLAVGAAAVIAALVWAFQVLRPDSDDSTARVVDRYETPEQTVAAYFAAVVADDRRTGVALVTPAARAVLVHSLATDFGNIASLTDLKTLPVVTPAPAAPTPAATASGSPSPTPTPVQTVVVPVTFTADYRNQITANDGPQKRAVVLTRAGNGEPWRIVSVTPSR
jgi:hypothetical protein